MTKIPLKRHTEKRRRQCDHGGGGWSVTATNPDPGEPSEAGKGKEGFSPRVSADTFRLVAFQTVRNKFLLFQTPGL